MTEILQGNGSSIAFSPDGSTLAVGSSSDGTVLLWGVATGNHINTLTGHTGHTAWIRSVAFSPDGRTLASGSNNGTVLLWQHEPTSAPIAFTPSTIANQTFVVNMPIDPLYLPLATGGTAPAVSYTHLTLPTKRIV